MANELLLEILNGNTLIVSLSLAIIGVCYLIHETYALGIVVWDWRDRASRRMRVALALVTMSIGDAIRAGEVLRWRMGGAVPENLSKTTLIIGVTILLLGFLCTIREISRPIFGNAPWLCTLVAMVLYTLAASLLRSSS